MAPLAKYGIAIALFAALGMIGCGEHSTPSESADPRPAVVAPAKPTEDTAPTAAPNDGRHDPFDKATRGGDDPPPGSNPPPDVTASGKSVYKIYKEVVRLWDTIRFVTPDGRRIDYSATIETDFGDIDIALRPDLAPNHVRNFVALARAGYYEELFFDRIRHEEEEVAPGQMQVLDCIEAGCPLGTGEPGNGSIGYWLRPELPPANAKVSHEPGAVGACHGEEADTAACRFYITLCDAPFLDGNFAIFGKVTRGLDVARKIAMQPIILDEQDAEGSHRPEKPIKIKRVTIHTSTADR
jgi:cyclophilin family peptidyl-prolyl cis-trans isomerase